MFIINLIVNTLAVAISAFFVPGVQVDTWFTAFIASVVLGIANTILKPILTILALPITILTLGLFQMVINVVILYLVAYLVEGFTISGFIPALIFSIVLSVVSWFLGKLK